MADEPIGADSLVWLEKEVVRQIIMKYSEAFPESFIKDDRAPAWLVVAASAYYSTAWMGLTDLTPPEFFDRVRADQGLKEALVSGFRFGVSSAELITLVLDWRQHE